MPDGNLSNIEDLFNDLIKRFPDNFKDKIFENINFPIMKKYLKEALKSQLLKKSNQNKSDEEEEEQEESNEKPIKVNHKFLNYLSLISFYFVLFQKNHEDL
jgi:hypothetical protein